MRVAVAINPTAGRGRGARAGHATLAALGAAGHRVVNVSRESYAASAAAVCGAGGVDALVVVGGDGMVHLGVNAVAGSDIPLGVVAVGTGNDFARAAGLPVADVHSGLEVVLAGVDGEPGCVDVGLASSAGGSVWFVGVLSAGLDAAVNAHANTLAWPRGRSRYVYCALREIVRFRPYGYRVSVWGHPVADEVAGVAVSRGADGSVAWESPGTLVAVANSGQFGGGVKIAPDASLTDGLFDVVVAGPFSRVGAARTFPGMYSGEHTAHRHVGVVKATRVRLEATDAGVMPPAAFADGERIGALPLEVRLVPGALRVIGR